MAAKKKAAAPKKKAAKKKAAPKPKEAAKKKAAKKKAAKKKAAPKPFSLLKRGATVANAAQETLLRRDSGKQIEGGAPVASIQQRTLIPIPELTVQAALGTRGIPAGSTIHMVGEDGVGKTTFFFTLAGWFALVNAPSLYIETENKLITQERAKAALADSKELADLLLPTITVVQRFTLAEAAKTILDWLKDVRDPDSEAYVPMHIPVLVGVDSYSKLLGKTESAALAYVQGKLTADQEKKLKELGGGSNFELAKDTHALCRQLPGVLNAMNAVFVPFQHQNAKIDMAAGGFGGAKSFVSPESSNKVNRTSNAGKGFDQNAVYQAVLTKFMQEKVSRDGKQVKIGQHINMTWVKNSLARPQATYYTLRWIPEEETEHTHARALDFYASFADLMHEKKILPVTRPTKRTVGCETLSDGPMTMREFHKRVHDDPELMAHVAKMMGIWGYDQPTPQMSREVQEYVRRVSSVEVEKLPEMPDDGSEDVPDTDPAKVDHPFMPKPNDQSGAISEEELAAASENIGGARKL